MLSLGDCGSIAVSVAALGQIFMGSVFSPGISRRKNGNTGFEADTCVSVYRRKPIGLGEWNGFQVTDKVGFTWRTIHCWELIATLYFPLRRKGFPVPKVWRYRRSSLTIHEFPANTHRWVSWLCYSYLLQIVAAGRKARGTQDMSCRPECFKVFSGGLFGAFTYLMLCKSLENTRKPLAMAGSRVKHTQTSASSSACLAQAWSLSSLLPVASGPCWSGLSVSERCQDTGDKWKDHLGLLSPNAWDKRNRSCICRIVNRDLQNRSGKWVNFFLSFFCYCHIEVCHLRANLVLCSWLLQLSDKADDIAQCQVFLNLFLPGVLKTLWKGDNPLIHLHHQRIKAL